MSEYKDVPAFLFANESVIDFYPRFGFRQVQTHRPLLKQGDGFSAFGSLATAAKPNPKRAVKLNVDDQTLASAIKNRTEFSGILDCLNTSSIQMFHLLKDYIDDIYYLPALDVIVIAYQEENRLFIADVIAKEPVRFDDIIIELPFRGVERIEFGFSPDWLGVSPFWEPVPMSDVMFFIKGDWKLPDVFRFPAMSET